MSDKLAQLEKKLKFKFLDSKNLILALTHKSYAVEKGYKEDNERLEFLGDSIMSAVMADHLYHRYPNVDEGRLSKLKSQIVSRAALSLWAKEIGLGEYLLLSQSEELCGGRSRDSIVGNTLEAIMGAMYLDQGYEKVRKFIINRISSKKRIIETDFKSKLQEYVQKKFQVVPLYNIVSETGPDHDKIFKVNVVVKDKVCGTGEGKNKKEAQQSAAKEAVKKFNKK